MPVLGFPIKAPSQVEGYFDAISLNRADTFLCGETKTSTYIIPLSHYVHQATIPIAYTKVNFLIVKTEFRVLLKRALFVVIFFLQSTRRTIGENKNGSRFSQDHIVHPLGNSRSHANKNGLKNCFVNPFMVRLKRPSWSYQGRRIFNLSTSISVSLFMILSVVDFRSV